MKTYTFSQARQKLATLLDEASREGEVRIRRRDGNSFVVQPLVEGTSPLDVPAVASDLTTAGIIKLVREGRRPRKADRATLAGGRNARGGKKREL